MVQLSTSIHDYGKTIALTIQTFVSKVISLIFNMLSRFVTGFPGGSDSKESACNAGDRGSIPGLGRSLEEGVATHFSIFAWRIPWTEEAGGLQSMGCKESETTERLSTAQHKVYCFLSLSLH